MKRLLAVVLSIAALCLPAIAQKGIEGVWRIVEVNITGPEARTISSPQPSLYIFTKKHYSVISVIGDSPRTAPKDFSSASADELRAVWGGTFVANGGTYELKDGKLTTRPTVAKNPGVMEPGSFLTMKYKFDGKNLVLTGESSNSGPVNNPTTVKLVRIE